MPRAKKIAAKPNRQSRSPSRLVAKGRSPLSSTLLAATIIVSVLYGVYVILSSHAASRPIAKLSPATGAYWGIFTGHGLTTRESEVGRTFAIDQKYYSWTGNFPGASEAADIAAGRIPLDTWQPWNSGTALSATTDSDIASGKFDATIIARAQAVKKFGHPLFLRFAHEMNGNWYPWGGSSNNNDPALYVAAWQHVHDIFVQQGATNAVWVWCPNVNSDPSASWNNADNYYPGNSYVDWVGIDGYNWSTTLAQHSWESFASIFGSPSGVYANYAATKPIMIAETASVETGAPTGASKAQWISDMANSITNLFPGVEAILWFDATGRSGNTGWPIDTSSSSLSAYTAAGHLAYFNPAINWGTPAPTAPPPPSSTPIPTSTPSTMPSPTPYSSPTSSPTAILPIITPTNGGSPPQVTVDGSPVSSTNPLNTTYLTNGKHTVTITSNGKTITKIITVNNHLTPFEKLRNFLFPRFVDHPALMNAGTIAALLLPIVITLLLLWPAVSRRLPRLQRAHRR